MMTGNAIAANGQSLSCFSCAGVHGRTFYVQRVQTAYVFDTGCGGFGNSPKTEPIFSRPVTTGCRERVHF
jgi:hypothetical protein